ncbi:SMAD/FHA domain-containing protein [Biscogniauxia sp. FL1348]|nr:SMAD/FHA domain-containing protein [Biscogniauxia sp. FL1348]
MDSDVSPDRPRRPLDTGKDEPRRENERVHDHDNDYDHRRGRSTQGSHRERSHRHRDRRSRSGGRRRHRRSRSPTDSRQPSPSEDGHGTADGDRDRGREHRRRRSRDYDKHGERESHRSRASKDQHRHRDQDRRDRDRDRDRGRDKDRDRNRDRDRDRDREKDKQVVKRNGPLPSQADSFAITNGEEPPKPKEKPNFGNTGALAAASNSVVQSDGSTIVLKYHEPPEARKPSPKDQWKLFVFKGDQIMDTVPLSSRSCWLVGRELAIVDLAAEHPSISKQHAVIQFRYLEKRNEYGDKIGKVKPYLIDLESANGTKLNSKKVPDSRYLELRDKDMIQFGESTREYVLMLAPKD